MSILIKGMGMPYGCANCPFVSGPVYGSDGRANYFCKVDVEGVRGNNVTTEVIALYEGATEAFPRFCPLIELPEEHGRLIDADVLKDTLDYYIREAGWSDEINEALTWVRDEFIDHEPTVIEAEGVSE